MARDAKVMAGLVPAISCKRRTLRSLDLTRGQTRRVAYFGRFGAPIDRDSSFATIIRGVS